MLSQNVVLAEATEVHAVRSVRAVLAAMTAEVTEAHVVTTEVHAVHVANVRLKLRSRTTSLKCSKLTYKHF